MKCLAGLAIALAAGAASAAPTTYKTLGPDDYQAFVGNWAPTRAPQCAAITDAARWGLLLHPAPTMGEHKPFGPPDAFWKTKAVVLVARVVNAGDTRHVLALTSVRHSAGGLDVAYRFTPTAAASSTIKWWMGVSVPAPLPATVRLIENGKTVCTLHPKTDWAVPSVAAP